MSNGIAIRQRQDRQLPGASASRFDTINTFRHNQLVSSQTGNGPLVEYTHNLNGDVLTMRVGGEGGPVTTFTYNNRGQLTRTTDAMTRRDNFTLCPNGLVLTHTDRNGTVFNNTYDQHGRLRRVDAVVSGNIVASRQYNFYFTGLPQTRTAHGHTITYHYDAQGRLIRQTETGGVAHYFTYNAANNRLTHQLTINGTQLLNTRYSYNNAQRPYRTWEGSALQESIYYDANHRVSHRLLHNGAIRTNYTRNLAGLATEVITTNATGTNAGRVLSHFRYTYHLDGNIQQIVEVMNGNPYHNLHL